jgi:biotin transporter BioY
MKSVLFGFGVVYLLGAVWLIVAPSQILEMKNLAVLVFFSPGVVALVAGLEVARLRREVLELHAKDGAPGAS